MSHANKNKDEAARASLMKVITAAFDGVKRGEITLHRQVLLFL